MRTVVVAGLLLASLSGCISETVGPTEIVLPTRSTADDAETSAGTDSLSGGSGATLGGPVVVPVVPNRAPSIRLEADVMVGGAPLAVAFTVEGRDPDGDSLRWALDVDSDGIEEAHGTGSLLPFTFEHTFASAGDFLATATLTDGRATDSAAVDIDALSGTAGSRQPQVGAGPNQRPRAVFSASVLEGFAPLSVQFTLGGYDYDTSDRLTWTLDTNSDGVNEATGNTLPSTFTKVYQTGIHLVTYRVSDGRLSTSTTLQVEVTDPPVEPPEVTQILLQLLANCSVQCGGDLTGVPLNARGCEGFQSNNMGLECVWTDLPAAAAGVPFLVESSAGDPDIEFLSSCDPATAVSVSVLATGGSEEGLVPAGARCLVAWEFALDTPPVEVAITYALEPDVLCPTSLVPDVVSLRTSDGTFYATIGDLAEGALFIYEETNGLAGLQRDDVVVPTDCPVPDTIAL